MRLIAACGFVLGLAWGVAARGERARLNGKLGRNAEIEQSIEMGHNSETRKSTERRTVSRELFFELEELSRLVGISYCVGYQGITKPFQCLSYCDEFKGVELVETWDSGLLDSSTCGYIALSHSSPPKILVIFRGSNSLSDAISDLMTLPAEYTPYTPLPPDNSSSSDDAASHTANTTQCTDCKVHAGFLSAWQMTRDTILPTIQDLIQSHEGYELVLAGHSLGGAIAGLAALEFEAMGWKPTVTTFGEPRFGNKELAEYVDSTFPLPTDNESSVSGDKLGRWRRVTRVGDPVPLYPLESWGWKMHSGEIYISKSKLPPSPEDLVLCRGPQDPACIEGGGAEEAAARVLEASGSRGVPGWKDLSAKTISRSGLGWPGLPTQWKLWEILFAHREYFWRLGLCWDPQAEGYSKAEAGPSADEL